MKQRTYMRDSQNRTAVTFTKSRRARYEWPATVLHVVMESHHLVPGETWESAHERGAITWRMDLADGSRHRSHSMRELARKIGAPRLVPAPPVPDERPPSPAPAPEVSTPDPDEELAALIQLGREHGVVSFRDLLALKRRLAPK